MVSISYYPMQYRLEARGHAGSGDPGRDLVCAGVSALVLTLRENLGEMNRIGGLLEQEVETKLGVARFRCRPAPGREAQVELMFECIVRGLRLLEKLFGAYVEVWEYKEE